MHVLFVSSGNSPRGITPIVKYQKLSLEKKNVKVDHFAICGKGLKGYVTSIWKLRKKLSSTTYDVVHAHYVLSGIVALLARARPLVVSFMGSDVHGDFDKNGKRTIKCYVNMILTQIFQPLFNYIIIKSKALKKYLYVKKYSILPNGVDLGRFKPIDRHLCRKRLNLPLDKKIIIFLGDPDNPHKNFNLAKEAFSLLNDPSYILLAPYPVPAEEVVYYINAADVLVLTSYAEGSPNVIKEAMACNVPIVATDVGDVREIIGQVDGCYIADFTPTDVARKLKSAIDFGKRTAGRKRIMELGLDADTIATKIIKIYHKLVHRKNGR